MTIDVNERLIWGKHKLHRKRFLLAAAFCVACLVIAFIDDVEWRRFAGWAGFAVGVPWAAYEAFRWYRPAEPLNELLPQGIIFRQSGGLEDFIVPWDDIHGVDSIDIETMVRGQTITFQNVTVILVSQLFYDRVIHVDNFIMRGPGWDIVFIPKGKYMQIALHHEILPVTAEEIRRQVEARWKAFGRKATKPLHQPI